MNLQLKLIVVVVPLIVASLLTFGVIAFLQMRNVTTENTTHEMVSVLDHINRNVEIAITTVIANTELFSNSPLIKKYLLQEDEAIRYQLFQRSLLKLFASYQHAYPEYYEIRVLTLDGYEDTRSTTRNITNFSEEEQETEFFKLLKNSNSEIVTKMSLNPDINEYALYVGKKITVTNTSVDPVLAKPILRGYLVITMDLQLLREIAEQTTIGESGRVYFVNTDNIVLFDKEKKHIGEKIENNLIQRLKSTTESAQLINEDYDSEPYLFQIRSPHPDIHLIGMLPKTELYTASREMGQTMLIVLIVFIFITGATLLVVLKRLLVSPILDLNLASQKIGDGDLLSPITTKTKDEIGKLSKTLDNMRTNLYNYQQQVQKSKEEAVASSQAKSQFLANMSHEIRTPLTAIIGFSEAVLEDDQTTEDRNESIKTVIHSGKHLMQIINDILDLSKIEAGRLEVEKLSLSPFNIIEDVKSLASLQAQEKGLHFYVDFELPIPNKISTDPVRLKQILINLCSNAIKFTSEGTVTITVKFLQPTNKLQFDVIDTGIGLAEEQLNKLFRAFSQADASTTRKFGGTGLGLFLSKQLAEKLGGDIVVDSKYGEGSQFSLTIDCGELNNTELIKDFAKAVPEKEETLPVLNENVSGSVLLAEDNINNQRLISMYIKKCGAEVDIADNGKIAVEKALQQSYDLILMDMQMPIMNGLMATETLRKAKYSGKIIALTANAMLEDKVNCIDAGCDDVFTKPIKREEFFNMLNQNLGNKSHTRDSVSNRKKQLQAENQSGSENLMSLIRELEANIKHKKYQELSEKINTLKSVSMESGLLNIYQTAAKVEFALDQNDLEEIQRLSNELKTCFNDIESYNEAKNLKEAL